MKTWGDINKLKEVLTTYDKNKGVYGVYMDQIEILIQTDENQLVLCNFEREPRSPEDGVTVPLLNFPDSHLFKLEQFEEIVNLILELTTGTLVIEDQTEYDTFEEQESYELETYVDTAILDNERIKFDSYAS